MLGKLFGRKEVEPSSLTIAPQGLQLEVNGKRPILDVALNNGVDFPHNCRVGGCGTCKCKLVAGEVKQLTDPSYVLDADDIANGYILACQAVPKGDVTVEIDGVSSDKPAMIRTQGTVTATKALTHDILEVTLTLDEPLGYVAGQFADLQPEHLPKQRSYSFANAPDASPQQDVVFHIRHVPGGEFTDWLHKEDRVGTRMTVSGAYGDFYVRPGTSPLVMVAGGSGMAPIKAVLEGLLKQKYVRDVVFYFGARTQADLYGLEDMREFKRNWLSRFEFIPVLSEEPEDSDWKGLRGLVTEPLAKLKHMDRHHAYMAGPPPMLDAAIAVLRDGGISADDIYFDKFFDASNKPT